MDIAPLRRRVLGNAVVRPDTLAASPAAIRALVLEGAQAAYRVRYVQDSARPDDPQAVTDSAGRVLGLEGLRVGDASVFPTIPCANIHLTVLMRQPGSWLTASRPAGRVVSDHGWHTTQSLLQRLHDLRLRARRSLPAPVFDFLDGEERKPS